MISCRDWWPWTKPVYISRTRRQSNNQWSSGIAAHAAPKNSECKNPLENFWPWFFLDQDGILLMDYLPKGQTINVEYYSSLLVQLKDIFKEKRRGKLTKGVLFLHDNAPAHRAHATQKQLAYLGFQCLIIHPILRISPRRTTTCSVEWKGRHFSSDAEVIVAAETWLDGQPSEFYWVACRSYNNRLRSVWSFVGSMLNKSWVWSL